MVTHARQAAGTRRTSALSQSPPEYRDADLHDALGFTPSVRISFRSDKDDARAWRLVADHPTVALPHRGMVADLRQLLRLRDAGISVYDLPADGSAPRYDTPLDIDALVAGMLKTTPVMERESEQTSVQPKRGRRQ